MPDRPYAVYVTTAADRVRIRHGSDLDPVIAALHDTSTTLGILRVEQIDGPMWEQPPVVVVSETAAKVLEHRAEPLPRRGNVVVASTLDNAHTDSTAAAAHKIGAQAIAVLPSSADWLRGIIANPPGAVEDARAAGDPVQEARDLLTEYDSWARFRENLGQRESEGMPVAASDYEAADDRGCDLADRLADALRAVVGE